MNGLIGGALLAVAATAALAGAARAAETSIPRYDHVFLVIEENHGFADIIGNKAAPHLNALAQQYGLATNSYSTSDPSAPNYVAMLGGNDFGIADDNAYYTHTVDKPSLTVQIEQAGLSWKGYYQGMPYPGYRGICFPGRCNGTPDFDPYYASKHNGVVYFKPFQDSAASQRNMVPAGELFADLEKRPPNFGYIVPDQCHDMHGSPPWCGDSGNVGDVNDNQLVSRADDYLYAIVEHITGAPFWSQGTNAIVITFDEGDDTASCCGLPGTGRIATVVITSRGPRALRDATAYNHYSLLRTIELAFGLGCLEHACDKLIVPMAPLFAVEK